MLQEIKWGNVAAVKKILRGNPSLSINWRRSGDGWSALHLASATGNQDLVTIVLAHPVINVNVETTQGDTPFMLACLNGHTATARLLLKDSRFVKPNQPGSGGFSPLRNVAYGGHLDIIIWWIVSGREMDVGQRGNEKTDAIEAARSQGKSDVVSTLERFVANPPQARDQLKRMLEIAGKRLVDGRRAWVASCGGGNLMGPVT